MGTYNSDRKNTRFYGLKLSRSTDAELIAKLDSVDSIQGYIKQLIKNDIGGGSKMKRIMFEAGTGRHFDGAVNYLISDDRNVYAECAVPEGVSDDYGYLTMVKAIREQLGNKANRYTFWYDGQENLLEADASADCEVYTEIDVD